jgi:hypothetical protein
MREAGTTVGYRKSDVAGGMMEHLLKPISDWFVSKNDHIRAFAECDTRVEGWFKGEMLVLLRNLKDQGAIEGFEREPNVLSPLGRKQVDFRITHNGSDHLVELKALCISRAAGTPRNLAFYFRDDHLGLMRDFRKLDSLPPDDKWVIGFIYPNPPKLVWEKALLGLPDDLKHWRCLTDPGDFPGYLFISLWKP